MAGLTPTGLGLGLTAALANGTPRYVALFTTNPGSDGVGAVEATGSGYGRASHSAWIDAVVAGVTYRKNDGTIEWAEVTGILAGIVGWGIYTASSGGSLLAFGPVRDVDGNEVTRNLAARDMARFLDQELQVAAADAFAELDIVDEGSVSAVQALMPAGVAWTRDPDAELTQLARAQSYEFSRIKKRELDLIEEIDPRTTTEMIGDWERVFGLPDECAQPTTLAGRRVALQGKMLGHLDPSLPNTIAIAAQLGYTINIHEYKRADLFDCESACTDYLLTDDWLFEWVVTTPSGATDAELECVLDSLNQLHTQLVVVFHYSWPSMMMGYADGVFVTVSAPIDPAPTNGRRPGASSDSDPAWIGIGWSPELNSPVLVGAPGTFCLQLS